MEIDIENAQVSILLESGGKVHLVAMKKENLKAITMLIKNAVEFTAPTNKSQKELRKFLNYRGEI